MQHLSRGQIEGPSIPHTKCIHTRRGPQGKKGVLLPYIHTHARFPVRHSLSWWALVVLIECGEKGKCWVVRGRADRSFGNRSEERAVLCCGTHSLSMFDYLVTNICIYIYSYIADCRYSQAHMGRGGGKGGMSKQVPSPAKEKWVPITKNPWSLLLYTPFSWPFLLCMSLLPRSCSN